MSDTNRALTRAVNAVAAIAWCSTEAVEPRSRSGDTDSATKSNPTSAPATVAVPLKNPVYVVTAASLPAQR
jgi:uncharacterized lipoprotein